MKKLCKEFKTDVISLKKQMIEKNLSKITELSEASGVDRNTLSKVLNEEMQPSSNVMYKLVKALELTPEKAGKIFFDKNLRST